MSSTNHYDVEKQSVQHDDPRHSALLSQPVPSATPQQRKFAATAPLGFFCFATTMFILSMYNAQAKGVIVPNIVVGMSLAVGGLIGLVAGIWEIANGNSLGGTAFSAYAGFWISLALIYIPGTGILAAYEGEAASQLNNALAIYLTAWLIFTFILFVGTFRTTYTLAFMFLLLLLSFLTLALGHYLESVTLLRSGGGIGVACSLVAYYIGAAGLYTPELSPFQLPLFPI